MVQRLTSQGLRAMQKPRVAPIAAALAQVQVLLVDAWGEVGLWGRLTTVAAVGGSWSAVGGHNPYEPLALGCHVLHGPNVHNFAEDYAALATLPTCHPAHDAAALARAVASVWDTTGSRPGASATPFTPEAAQAMLADLQTAAVSATRSAAPHPA
jgi:3-deoxy-D-manno-octulosonic-acid transferase